VGYSLGGRLALDYTLNAHNPMLLGSVLEGANIGLQTEEEKAARWQNDHAWATRFHNEPLATVLQDWYRQPVFANLSETQRTNLIQERKHNEGKYIAQMLESTSLAKQAFMRPSKQDNITFLIGEKDSKFRIMAENHSLPYQLIANAGHNAHRENPAEFTTTLQKLCQ
jgi:2-succinyl-6-hydroxy-2,4-cyclohexadiene-1-carboxylate synthase